MMDSDKKKILMMADCSVDETPLSNVEINPSWGMKLMLKGIAAKFSDVHHISTSTLSHWLVTEPKQVILLDTRSEDEYKVSHIEGAVRVDHDSTDLENILQYLPQNNLTEKRSDVKVVCYCSVGYRSSILAQKLHKYFIQQTGTKPEVYNLEGSIFKWANEKRRLVDENNQPTVYAHPYNSVWGKFLNKELRREGT